jgi:hypothetical protein
MRLRSRGGIVAAWLAAALLAAAVVGALLGGLPGRGGEAEPVSEASKGAPAPPPRPAPRPASPPVAVVWGIENAGRAARRLARSDAVASTAVLKRGTALLRSTRRSDGRTVERVRPGYAIPLDVVSVHPRGYAAGLPPSARRRVASLRRGEAVLSMTSARLRRVDAGGTLRLVGGRRLRVAAVLPDALAQSAELLVGASERMPSARESVLAVLREGARTSTANLARAAGGGGRARLIESGAGARATPLQGPARPAELKARFGEAAVALPYGDDWVRLDPGFVRRNLATRRVPILGAVTCHRRMLPALRAAMGELDRRGLGGLVDPGDYAGCYAPRRIRPGGALSLHAWGLAVDLNASANPFGGRSSQDRRLVRTMLRHGFSWGGDFPTIRDPMHFEFRGR